MAVRLMYYEHVADHLIARDPFTGWYEPIVQHRKHSSKLPLMSIHGSEIVDKVRMQHGTALRKRLTDGGVRKVMSWLKMPY